MKLADVIKMIPASQDIMIKWGARNTLYSGKCFKIYDGDAVRYFENEVATVLAVGNTIVVRIIVEVEA